MPGPVEAAADDSFDDEVIGGGGRADAYAEVDLPLWRNVEIGDGEDLLLLISECVGGGDATVVSVVLDAAADLAGEVEADFDGGGEGYALGDVGAMQGALERRVEGEVPTADGFIDDGTDLPSPGVGRVDGALVTDLRGEADADGPVP